MKKIFISEQGTVRAGWNVLATLLFIMVIGFFLTFLLMIVLSNQAEPWMQLVMYMGMPIGMIGGTLISLKLFNRMKVMDIGLRALKHSSLDLACGLGLGAASMTIIFLILWQTGAIALKNPMLEPKITNFSWPLVIVCTRWVF
ncbi:hypothetical protein [Ammoniphilus sp. 3BR4]|uniref:hypothetical protein n=1 Tax=Ammoniphilus sp. 3BR4 TaxID=3158265 RepID=UPI0034653609